VKNLNYFRNLFGIIISGLTVSGCASVSSLHTARTTPEGMTRITLGGGALSYPNVNSALQAAGYSNGVILGYGEAMVRRGFSSKFDMGVKYTIPIKTDVDLKFMFVDKPHFAMAMGLGTGFYYEYSSSAPNLYDLYVPIYMDIDIASWFTIYLIPKYWMRFLTGGTGSNTNYFSHLVVGTAGLKLGAPKFGILAEFSYGNGLPAGSTSFSSLTDRILQASGGLYFGF
jgi:hypothetical protein